jgi:predicted AAA+ superfamily ATPase
LAYRQVKSPALFRQTFEIICSFPAQEISYNKLLGQIQQRGNIDLVKHYLELFEAALLVKVIFKYSIKKLVKKSSSPKVILMAPCFYELFRQPGEEDKSSWNFESTVGAALLKLDGMQLHYWREGNFEVDFVLTYKKELYAIEVKSGRKKSPKGIIKFQEKYPHARAVFITRENYKLFIENPATFLDG